ncbi:MAG: hypothetical protein HOC23_13545 [Halieaceae bacterium]|jgi:hypothetical protein|nr:hypothetical protein [Halieaceae bacterium]
MTHQDYQLLSQYIDGELSASAAHELRKRLIAEPELRATLESLEQTNDRVACAFATPEANAVPAHVTAMLESAETTTTTLSNRQRAHWAFGLAASLAVASGLLIYPEGRQDTAGYANIGSYNDAQLSHVLEQTPSGSEDWETLADGRQVRPVLSFAIRDGVWCREYLVSGKDDNWRGVACRNGGHWTTEVIEQEQLTGSSSEYRTAGATDSATIASFIDNNASDIALGSEEEAAMIAKAWQ